MRKITITKAEDDLSWFERANAGFTVTGEYLTEDWGTGCSQTLVVMRGPRTLFGMCRDCGDHYIIARFDRFDRINKDTLELVEDVEDF